MQLDQLGHLYSAVYLKPTTTGDILPSDEGDGSPMFEQTGNIHTVLQT